MSSNRWLLFWKCRRWWNWLRGYLNWKIRLCWLRLYCSERCLVSSCPIWCYCLLFPSSLPAYKWSTAISTTLGKGPISKSIYFPHQLRAYLRPFLIPQHWRRLSSLSCARRSFWSFSFWNCEWSANTYAGFANIGNRTCQWCSPRGFPSRIFRHFWAHRLSERCGFLIMGTSASTIESIVSLPHLKFTHYPWICSIFIRECVWCFRRSLSLLIVFSLFQP